jgi:hypothetical protein
MGKFQFVPTGPIYITPGALEVLGEEWPRFLKRHIACDWSEMDEEDQEANRRALERGGRVFSAYWYGKREKRRRVWVITEADRSYTTILLASEY